MASERDGKKRTEVLIKKTVMLGNHTFFPGRARLSDAQLDEYNRITAKPAVAAEAEAEGDGEGSEGDGEGAGSEE